MMKKVINKGIPLYIHIPFCTHLCAYCDFPKLIYDRRFVGAFLDALINEIDSYNLSSCPSIYIGGGTPSSLSINELDSLLSKVSPLLKENGEFTIECNIENINVDKLRLFKKYGINRLSFGVQSFNDELLMINDNYYRFSSK